MVVEIHAKNHLQINLTKKSQTSLSVKASFQIQVEMDFAGGGSNPAWDHNLYSK